MKHRTFTDVGHAHFLTFSCFHRHQFLTSDFARRCLCDAIAFARARHNFALWAYVIMPEHVHLLIHPHREEYSIAAVLRDIKEQPSRRVIEWLRQETPWVLKKMEARQGRRVVHRLWQAGGGYDRNLFSGETIRRAIEYIEWNPVKRQLVECPCDWAWSSARARAGAADVPLSIDDIDVMLT